MVHGGDVFHRSRVPPSLVYQAFQPLMAVADRGIPVVVVPGNHERSRIPHGRLAAHPHVHVFDDPRTYVVRVQGVRVALSGFPYERRDVRSSFPALVAATGGLDAEADLRLLCVHHCVEGATVGPGDHVFRDARDVIRGADIPPGFAGVLSGHIHRHQVLTKDLSGRALNAPVYYPGSVERTSTAEIDEEKGYLVLECSDAGDGTWKVDHRFVPLPARPMIVRELRLEECRLSRDGLADWLTRTVRGVPADTVLRIRVHGTLPDGCGDLLSADRLRRVAPAMMNVDVVLQGGTRASPRRRPATRRPETEARSQILLPFVEPKHLRPR